MKAARPIILMINDGWGIAPPTRGNAIAMAKTPFFTDLTQKFPTMTLAASGEVVGLPWGEIGNSEVGHLCLGGGKILYQSLPRVNRAITDGSFYRNEAFLSAMNHVRRYSSRLHLVGLVSAGGVHSHHDHLYALIELAVREKIDSMAVHVFLDGRDTGYRDGRAEVEALSRRLAESGAGSIASIAGRYYAMDRDNRWERVESAYRAIVEGASEEQFSDPVQAIDASYAAGVYDEEFRPVVITDNGIPYGKVNDHDAIIFFNFRPDRARELTAAISVAEFAKFKRPRDVKDLHVVTMTEYEKDAPVVIAFPPEYIDNPLARILSDHGYTQLHIAETEKYAHVTFFLNGGREDVFPGEDRVLIPSPQCPSYDEQPAMSALELTERAVQEIEAKKYDFIALNFANADMVGHTGNMPKIVEAVEILDSCMERVVSAMWAAGGLAIITADHGNAEEKLDLNTGVLLKDHTTNPVPCIVADPTLEGQTGRFGVVGKDLSAFTPVGILADVAPTILQLYSIEKPLDMTGRSLL